ncbi:Cytochrome P450 monooxygenase FUM15 [Hyphodiscus hymeniophilus]|uniref:Cytochrome P450 monooxygenase FUM15 n=1 Tax=Hyphodiscus hymeniophilus TaxID=353542 RepID=A0A9P7AUH3_9HELO|nr:Cytochrome P450 monooxygenase FUM15 [Hyphodiscus hymeniophilus]
MALLKQAVVITSLLSYLFDNQLAQYRYLLGHQSYAGDFLQLLILQVVGYLLYLIVLYPRCFSPLRHLPGPKVCDYFFHELQMVLSPEALREMLLTKCYNFIKPKQAARLLIYFFGAGMPFVEGDTHKFQKKTMMPAFTFRHIMDLYPVFWRFSKELLVEVSTEVEMNTGRARVTNAVEHPIDSDQSVLNVVRWFKTITLDIMGVAGMGQDFEARKNKDNNQLVQAYHTLFAPDWQSALVYVLRSFRMGQIVQYLPLPKNAEMEKAKLAIRDTCRHLIQMKSNKLENGELSDVDILSVAIQSGGFTEECLIDQITTFLLAGHETTAVSMTWACYGLCQHPEVQTRLRNEIRGRLPSPAGADDITSLDIDRIPYLKAVCNEVLRYYDVFVWTRREAAVDTSLLGQPIPKGTAMVIPFRAIHRDKSLWGHDADVFNPDRWMSDSSSGSSRVSGGATSNFGVMSFLHGPRSCIGENFARAEFACLLAAWVGRFEFELNDKREMDEEKLKTAGGFTTGPVNGLDVRIRIVDGW